MIESMKAWQCIGCGRIEAPQQCVGICQDRKVELVYADEHRDVCTALEAARQQVRALEGVVRRLATTHPNPGQWELSYRTLQRQARAALAEAAATSRTSEAQASAPAADAGTRAMRRAA
jgi:hypothetical protein